MRTTAALAISMLMFAVPMAATAQTNVALGAVASQSSTAFEGDAGRAIDGNIDGGYPNGSVTHTDAAIDSAPSWEVDLGSDHQIAEIVLWNRTDCCAERLYAFSIEVVTESKTVVPIGTHGGIAPREFRPALPLEGVVGRIVRVRLELDPSNLAGRTLSLAEVQVFGSPVGPPPPGPGRAAGRTSPAPRRLHDPEDEDHVGWAAEDGRLGPRQVEEEGTLLQE